ncbi:MAG: SDR family oxidoreductase [Saccharofermentans sp.]|nr:SDR family oxidoreductase [Saccharofermentans sp.]
MNDTAIVTGASSGIGLAIANMLVDMGFDVVGIGRNFENSEYHFKCVKCDITDTSTLIDSIKDIKNVSMLVNCAGVGFYGLHENLSIESIKDMIRTNLEAPMVLTNFYLSKFKSQGFGTIVFISSVTAFKTNTYGAAYGAIKSGLSSFAASVFEEARKHNIKVIEICPDMTATNLYRNADFNVDDDPRAYLEPSDVASVLKNALELNNGCITRLTIVPQINRVKRH